MKTIQSKARRLVFATALGVVVCFLFYVLLPVGLPSRTAALALLAITTVVLAVLALSALRLLASARLIAENELLHICPAVNAVGGGNQPGNAAMNISVSCFGILLDSRVIRFNHKANRLRLVEIGREVIALTYGPDTQVEQMVILHPAIDDGTARSIALRFHFETGAETVLDTGFIK